MAKFIETKTNQVIDINPDEYDIPVLLQNGEIAPIPQEQGAPAGAPAGGLRGLGQKALGVANNIADGIGNIASKTVDVSDAVANKLAGLIPETDYVPSPEMQEKLRRGQDFNQTMGDLLDAGAMVTGGAALGKKAVGMATAGAARKAAIAKSAAEIAEGERAYAQAVRNLESIKNRRGSILRTGSATQYENALEAAKEAVSDAKLALDVMKSYGKEEATKLAKSGKGILRDSPLSALAVGAAGAPLAGIGAYKLIESLENKEAPQDATFMQTGGAGR